MKKKTMLKLCYAVIALAFAVLIFSVCLFVDRFFGFDEEWLVGRTLGEVMERYGPPDLVHDMGMNIAYNRSLFRSLVYSINGSYTNSKTVITSLNPDMSGSVSSGEWHRYPSSRLFASWAQGKPLRDVLDAADKPLFCVPETTVIYGIEQDYVVLLVEKGQDDSYFVSDAYEENSIEKDPSWQPWDPNVFGISEERHSHMGWLIGCIAAGVLGIAAVAIPVFLRKRKATSPATENE